MLIFQIFLFFIFFVLSLQVTFEIFCDDYCSAFYVDGVDQNINIKDQNFRTATIDLNIGIGNLLTIVTNNKYSHIGICFKTEINGKVFSSSDLTYVSWNSSKVFPSNLYNYAAGPANFIAQYADPYEVREYYIYFSNNLLYKNSQKRAFVNTFISLFAVDSITIIDTAITKDDIVNNWKIVLVETPKFGEIYSEDDTTKIEDLVINVQNLHYHAVIPAKREIIKFRLENGNIKSPLSIINIIICDEGCVECDENNYMLSVEEKICLGCKSQRFSYRMKCYQQCPDFFYSIDDEWKCVEQCDESPYLFYKDKKCVKNCDSPNYLYKANNTCYTSCPSTMYTNEDKNLCVDDCDSNQFYDGSKCVNKCENKFLYQNNKNCYDACPSYLFYIEKDDQNECVDKCEDTLYPYYDGRKCVSTCGSKYLYEPTHQCYSSCPSSLYTIENEHLCVDDCTSLYPYYDGRKCVSNCGSKYLYEPTHQCYSSCPSSLYTIENEHLCVDDCSTTLYPYYDNNKCVSDCGNNYIYEPTHKCYSSCPSSLYPIETEHLCVDDCRTTLYPYYDDNKCVSTCGDKFLYEPTHQCYSSCPSTLYTVDNEHLCVDDCNAYNFLYFADNKCLSNCGDYFLYEPEHRCYTSCPSSLYIIDNLKQCVDACVISPYTIYDDRKCVSECPPKYIIENNHCVLYNQLTPTDDDSSTLQSNLDKESILDSILDYKDDYLSSNKTIIGDDYSLQIIKLNQTIPDSPSTIDLSPCIETLKKLPEYASTSEFLIVKLDLNRTDSLCPQTEYQILADNIPVDLSLCNETKVEVKYTIDPSTSLVNLTKVNEMLEQGIDIFNPDDPFFSDICVAFTTEDNADIPLKDRRKELFQDVNLCDTGCQYKGYNPETYEVTCDCNIKQEVTLEQTEPSKEFFNSVLDNTNLRIVVCYNLLLNFDNYIDNYGFLIYLCVFVFFVILFVYYCVNFNKILFSELFHNIKSSPATILSKPTNSSTVTAKEKSVLESSDRSMNSILEEKNSEKNIQLEKEEDDLNECPYSIALSKDHRTIPQIFKDYLIYKIDIINVLFFPNKYEFLCISLTLYLFCVSVDFTFNSILFTDDVISSTYHNGGQMNYALTLGLSVISNVLGSIVSFFFVRLSLHSQFFETIEKEVKEEVDYLKLCKEVYKKIRIRLGVFYTMIFVFFLFFWYYVTIFCIVYKGSQKFWLKDCVNGIFFEFLFVASVSVIASVLRSFALSTQSKNMYYVARYLIYEI